MEVADNKIIFLISLPRSGSTLLQHILGSHSKISASAEPWVLFPLALSLKKGAFRANYNPEIGRKALCDFLNQLDGGEDHFFEATRHYANYLYGARIAQSGKVYFVDKTSRYYLILPELLKVFPDAKFIFLFRNPISIFSSFVESMAGGNILKLCEPGIASDLFEGLHLITRSLDSFDNKFIIQYEELVSKPEYVVNQLCKFLNIEFEAGMINYGSVVGTFKGQLVDRKSIHLHNAPVKDYLNNWRKVLNTPQLILLAKSYIQHLGRDIVTKSGYDFDEIESAIGEVKLKHERVPLIKWRDLARARNPYYKRMLMLIGYWQRTNFLRFLFKFCRDPIKNAYSFICYVRD